jgi:intracellular septation protein
MSEAEKQRSYPRWLPAALDYAPLAVFFLAYRVSGIFVGTATFMAAIILSIIIALWKVGRVSPMTWISAILILVFGGITIWRHDQTFIQQKPTIIYAIMSAILFFGMIRKRPMLKYVFEHGFDGLSDAGWALLSRNWAWFFAALAIANEILRHIYSGEAGFGTWLTIKIFGFTAAIALFSIANVPMLMKHGLGEEEGETPETP